MRQSDGAEDARVFPLPPPREIESEMLKKLLIDLGRKIPTLDWLITKYPHLPDVRPAWTAQPETEPNFGQFVPNTTNDVAGAMTAMPNGSAVQQSAALQDNTPQGNEFARREPNVYPQSSQQTARPIAPTHAGAPQHSQFDSGVVQPPHFGMQASGSADALGVDLSSEDQKKRGRQADVAGENGLGNMPKKNKSGFSNTMANADDDSAFPALETNALVEGQQPRRGPLPAADMGQVGMRSSQFSSGLLPPAPQMRGKPSLAIDENGYATVAMEQRQGDAEPDDDFLGPEHEFHL